MSKFLATVSCNGFFQQSLATTSCNNPSQQYCFVSGIDLDRQMDMIASVPLDSMSVPVSVTELTARIKQMLEGGFAKVQVSGEVSRLTRPSSGHLYFTIKDAHAAISAVIWRSTAMRLQDLPQQGSEFIFTGHISLYEPRGSYQLVVSRMQAAGAGKLAAEFERRKQAMAARGCFDAACKQSIPALPEHIGIVTSPTSAACEDVKKILSTRPAWLKLSIAAALVQGSSAPNSIARALAKLSNMAAVPDVILLVRGGGSIEDLWCFNDEIVVNAILTCPIPIISGVGHEIDTTLADLTADVRAATPSNAAEIVCPSRHELRQRMPRMTSLQQLLQQRLSQMERDRNALIQRQQHAWRRHTDGRHHATAQQSVRLSHNSRLHLQQARNPLRRLEKRLLPLQPFQRLQQQRLLQVGSYKSLHQNMQTMLQLRQQVLCHSMTSLHAQRQKIQFKRQRLAVLCGELKELDPTRVLQRGYTLSFTEQGKLITDAALLQAGEMMHTQFRDGQISSRVESTKIKSKSKQQDNTA